MAGTHYSEEWYFNYLRENFPDHPAISTSNMEQGFKHASATKDEPQEGYPLPCFQEPVRITITSYRKRLCDPGQLCDKWVIDAIVCAGILPDDNSDQITEIIQRQVKSKNEHTEILIEAVSQKKH